jgi:hypothetical protein
MSQPVLFDLVIEQFPIDTTRGQVQICNGHRNRSL